MNEAVTVKNPKQIVISDRVKFYYRNQEFLGYVAKKGRKYACVVCDNKAEYRVPYEDLYQIADAPKEQMQTNADRLRSRFNANDRVSFEFRGQVLSGTISRLNAKRAHVVCEDDKEYQVPYAWLKENMQTMSREDRIFNLYGGALESRKGSNPIGMMRKQWLLKPQKFSRSERDVATSIIPKILYTFVNKYVFTV